MYLFLNDRQVKTQDGAPQGCHESFLKKEAYSEYD